MPDYLIDIRTNLHPEEIEAYVQRVQRAMSTLASRSSVAGSTSGDLAGDARITQAKAYATGIASSKTGTLGQEGLIKLNAALDATFGKAAQSVKTLNENWSGKGGVLLNQQDLQRRSGLLATNATARAGGSGDDDVQQQAAQQEATRLTKQRVAEEAVRLEAAQRGIVFAEESTAAEREAAVKVARRAEVEQVKVLAAERALAEESGIPELLAQQKVAQRQLNEMVNARVRQIERENAEQAGTAGNASFFQRAQAYFANRNKPDSAQKDASEFSTGGQFISQRLFQGGAYAIAGTALYTMVGNIRSLIDEGEKTQVMFGQLKAQLTEVGQADKFPQVRDDILDMAHASGVAADQVTQLMSTMLGAFTAPQEAIQATNAGLALMQVSGLSLTDVQNNLVAIMRTFGITGAEAMSKVDDEVNHLHDTFGVAQKEIVDGVGNIAPLAQDMGLSFRDASIVISGAAAVSGRSATQTANEIGRALTQIEKQLPIITQVLNQPASQGLLSSIEGDVGQGKTGQVLIDLIRHWKELSAAQQNSILTAIGGRREFASLAAALGENQKIIKALDDTTDQNGVTAQRLAEYHRTLSYQLKASGEAFKQLGVAILNSPLGQGLALIVHAGGDVTRWIDDFLRLLGSFNSLMGGIPGQVLAWAAAWIILKNVLSLDHLKQAYEFLLGIGRTLGKVSTPAPGKTGVSGTAAETGTAIQESGTAAAGAMRTGIVEGGAEAATAMRTAMAEAGAGWALEARTVTGEEMAAINASIVEFEAAEQQLIAELSAELSALAAEQATSAAGWVSLSKGLPVQGVGADLAETAAAGGAAGKLAGGIGAALGPLASFATALEAALPVIAVIAGYKIGQALAKPVEDVTSPKGPNDIVLRRNAFSSNLTSDTKKQLDDYYGTLYKRLQDQGKSSEVAKAADKSLPDRSLLEKITLTPRADISAKRRQIEDARKAQGAFLGQGGNQQYNQDVITALEQSGAISGDAASSLAEGISKNDYETYKKVTELYNKHKTGHPKFTEQLAQARQEGAVISGDAVKTAQDLQKEFESGQINFQQLQDGLNQQLDVYKQMAQKAGGEANLPQQVQQQMDALQDQVDKNNKDRTDGLIQAQDTREQADASRKGRPEQIQAELAKAQRDLAQAQKYDDPAKEAQAYAEQQKAAQEQEDYDTAARKSKTDIARARASANFDPVGAAQADLDQANDDLATAKDDAAKQEAQAQIIDKTFALQQAKDAVDKTRRAGHSALIRAYAEANYDPVGAAQADLDLAIQDYNANRDPAQQEALAAAIVEKRLALQQAADQLAQTRRAGHAQLLAAQASARFDPVGAALADLQAAQGDLAANRDPAQREALQARLQQAQNTYDQTLVDQATALNQLRQDQDKGNAGQVALEAVDQATADVQRIVAAGGYGTKAWADAERALLDAQRQAVDAAVSQIDAILNYDEALANAAGDNVRAANDELKKAQAAYDAAVQEYGANSDQAKAASTDIVNKQAALRDAQLKTSEDNIQFQLEMGQISTAQAIAQYEMLLTLVQGNQQETQDILLKINQLRKQASQNLQFDIPSQININGLLYQARRLDQLAGAGMGYNDNRNISVQYNVYTPMDHQQTMNDLADALSGSPRTGNTPRTYP